METISCTYCNTQSIYGDRTCPGCQARIYYGIGWLDLFKWSALVAALFTLLFIEITGYFALRGLNKYAWYVAGIPFFMAAVIIARLTRKRVQFLHYPRI